MRKGLMLNESMSGWLQTAAGRQSFSIAINAFTPALFRFNARRFFTGSAIIGNREVCEVRGVLTIHSTGPEYHFLLRSATLGCLQFRGRKRYQLRRLLYSMTHCPLEIIDCKQHQAVGSALLAYRDSVLAFPFKAVSLSEEPQWYSALAQHFPDLPDMADSSPQEMTV